MGLYLVHGHSAAFLLLVGVGVAMRVEVLAAPHGGNRRGQLGLMMKRCDGHNGGAPFCHPPFPASPPGWALMR